MIPSGSKKKNSPINRETPLGFDEESKIKQFTSLIRTRFKRINKEAKYSGVYNNFWLWNTIFLNLSLAIILGVYIKSKFGLLPELIGLNIDNVRRFDTVVSKSYLYSIVVAHLVFAVVFFGFGLKAEKRLNHLIIAAFFNFLALGLFEFLGLRSYINYFS